MLKANFEEKYTMAEPSGSTPEKDDRQIYDDDDDFDV